MGITEIRSLEVRLAQLSQANHVQRYMIGSMSKRELVRRISPIDLIGTEWEWMINWNTLSSHDLARVLSKYPHLADRCNLKILNPIGWITVLVAQPQLYQQYPPWEYLCGTHLGNVLADLPHLIWFCDLSRLTGGGWSILLSAVPYCAMVCDWAKLSDGHWRLLQLTQPRLFNKYAPTHLL